MAFARENLIRHFGSRSNSFENSLRENFPSRGDGGSSALVGRFSCTKFSKLLT